MEKHLYLQVEGPKGIAAIKEIASEASSTSPRATFEPQYEVSFNGTSELFSSEGEAVTVAQELVGLETSY